MSRRPIIECPQRTCKILKSMSTIVRSAMDAVFPNNSNSNIIVSWGSLRKLTQSVSVGIMDYLDYPYLVFGIGATATKSMGVFCISSLWLLFSDGKRRTPRAPVGKWH